MISPTLHPPTRLHTRLHASLLPSAQYSTTYPKSAPSLELSDRRGISEAVGGLVVFLA